MGVVTSADMSKVVLSGETSVKEVALTSQRLYQWSVKKQCFEMGERENVTGSYKKRSENSTEDDNVWLLINSLNRGITEAVLMAEE